jgi:exodeoxyribonuclease V alpha subunit
MVLSATQLAGAMNALTAPVSVLTGLPGTGKTTTLKAVVSVLKDAEVPFLLCAPTGIAAKRMSALTGAEAATIHRAFGARGWKKGEDREATYVGVVGDAQGVETSDGSAEEWGHGPDNPHPARVVIVDEFSMVDQHLLFRLLTCTGPTCRLVFVGDAAQLPSVGAGNVLRDILETGRFPTVSLTEIFRQEGTSGIVVAAHAVHRGEVPDYNGGPDFVLIGIRSEDDILNTVVDIAGRLYGKRRNFQVLSPRHAGTLGVTNLNQKLREVINPKAAGLAEMRLGSEIVRENDRIMVVKNNYDLGIFNGDVGKIVRVDLKAGKVEIKIHGPPVQNVIIPSKDAPTYLRMAYAMTVHKSQGQEYDVIVLPMTKGFGHQLQRNLFYTAITRARKQVLLVGHSEAVARAVYNDREDARNTLFPDRLNLIFAASGGSAVASSA